MAIHHAYEEINETFDIYGLNRIAKDYIPVRFKRGINFDGFLFKRKEFLSEVNT
ncbi:hypothetical protein SAMN05443550_113103 [Pedobacter hartonius]|uniref:Uncharacterized protein n=2 Tax=Pedobacter hartonius TaxID=425514 RepID=A0A1H4H4U5_9SPHI|nr:hypothetical protein SAMN05443550_113103 [Pedobacter hartonius]